MVRLLLCGLGVLLLGPAAVAAAAGLPETYTPRPAEHLPRAGADLMLGLAAAGSHLIAVGDRGQILASRDGRQWVQVDAPVREALTAVQFVDAQQGWAVGQDAVILHTQDGGRHWTLQNFEPERQRPLLDVLFLDARQGFAIGAYGLMLATDDGGLEWREVQAPAVRSEGLHLFRIVRLGDGSVLIAGEQGLLAASPDRGQHWIRLRAPDENTLFGIAAVGRRGAVLCGVQGRAFFSRDVREGRWQRLHTGVESALFAVDALNDRRAVLAGADGVVLVADLGSGRVAARRTGLGDALAAVLHFGDGLVLAGDAGLHWSAGAP